MVLYPLKPLFVPLFKFVETFHLSWANSYLSINYVYEWNDYKFMRHQRAL